MRPFLSRVLHGISRAAAVAPIGVLFLASCARDVQRTTEPATEPVQRGLATSNELTAPRAELVFTPAGWYHRSCVQQVENRARVGRDGVVTREDGTSYRLPECLYPGRRTESGDRASDMRNAPPTNSGWMEWAVTYQSGSSLFRGLSARWDTPSSPAGSYTGIRVYYTFPGLVSTVVHPYIIQPVLQYGYNGAFGGARWVAASWHCDDGSNCTYSTPIDVTAGDEMLGTVTASSCQSGQCSWTIIARDLTRQTQSTYVITDVDQYQDAYGGAVEVYGLSDCSQYPSTGVFFSAIALNDQNGQGVVPSWSSGMAPNPDPSCDFGVSTGTYTVALYHNPPPPPGITVTVTGPSTVDGCTSATWTATASNGTAPFTYEWSVEDNTFNTGTNNQLTYTNTGEAPSIFVTATATDANGSSGTSAPFKTNIRRPGGC